MGGLVVLAAAAVLPLYGANILPRVPVDVFPDLIPARLVMVSWKAA